MSIDISLEGHSIDLLRQVARFIQTSKYIKNRKDLIDTIMPGVGVTVEGFFRNSNVPRAAYEEATKYINEKCSVAEKAYIKSLIDGDEKSRDWDDKLSMLLKTINIDDDYGKYTPGDIEQRCSNIKGKYILFRASGEDKYYISSMRIYASSKVGTYLPVFRTERFDSGTDERVVNGIIFQTGETLYAVGQVKGSYRLRISKLNYRQRFARDRMDLYGIRLGHSEKYNKPHAYRIFAYQVMDYARFIEARSMMKNNPFVDNRFFEAMDIKIGKEIHDCIHGNNIVTDSISVYMPLFEI